MTPSLLFRLSRLARRSDPGRQSARPRSNSRRGACVAVATFALAVVSLNAVAMFALDKSRPGIRDPEYGRRVSRYRARVAENPGRPVVLVVGSSRAAMGVRPAAWEDARPGLIDRPDPLLFNMSLLGSGPLMQLMVVRRARADGLRPDVVLIEYWPPFLYSKGSWFEPNRVAADRLLDDDRDIVRRYYPDPAATEREMNQFRKTPPLLVNRERLLLQIMPDWLPPARRTDFGWSGLDPWGWLPGFDLPTGPSATRDAAVAACRDLYKPLFDDYRISPHSDRALREAVATARESGAAVGFVHLPESSMFRRQYSPAAERATAAHLAKLRRELGLPLIDARMWMDDDLFVDGFHLSRIGAAAFTRRLGPAVAETFPHAGERP